MMVAESTQTAFARLPERGISEWPLCAGEPKRSTPSCRSIRVVAGHGSA
jgi:hypothetical protein